MDTLTSAVKDSLIPWAIRLPNDTTQFTTTNYGEIDAYWGTTSFDAATAPSSISVNVKHITAGLRYNIKNFSGQVRVVYDGMMPEKIFSSAADAYKTCTYSLDHFRVSDSSDTWSVPMVVKWTKPGGTEVSAGYKVLGFGRNKLTTINVTLPTDGTPLITVGSDTTWSGNTETGLNN